MSNGNIPQVRTWRATFYGFGNLKLGSVTVLAPTKLLARLGLFDAIMGSDKGPPERRGRSAPGSPGASCANQKRKLTTWPKRCHRGPRHGRMVKT
jgi:hypothetical protein